MAAPQPPIDDLLVDPHSTTSTIVDSGDAQPLGAEKGAGGCGSQEARASADAGEGGAFFVDWEGPDDPANPMNFSRSRKWLIAAVGIFFAGIVSAGVSGYSFYETSLERELGISHELAALGLTLLTFTFGAVPLVLSPLSEVFGRNSVYLISIAMYAIWLIPQAVAKNVATLLIARCFAGAVGGAGINLVGGTLADVFPPEERGLWMALFVISAVGFVGIGPLFFGWAVNSLGFRWYTWVNFGLAGAFFVCACFILKETRASVLLSRKAARLRKETGLNYRSRDEAAALSTLLKIALSRPFKILFKEPIVIAFTMWISFAWGVNYMCLGSIEIVFEGVYGFSKGVTGVVYVCQFLGCVGAAIIDRQVSTRLAKRWAHRGTEAGLGSAMMGGVLFPIGCWIYGLTARPSCHFMGPIIGIQILYIGNGLIFLSVFGYLASSYSLYAASALAAMNVVRNTIASVFPLFTTIYYGNLGIQNAGILTASLATGLGVIPFLLFAYGARLRAKSPFNQMLARLEEEEREKRRLQEKVGEDKDVAREDVEQAKRDVEDRGATVA